MNDSTGNSSATPGWYPDGQGNRRWWDGSTWTDQTQPLETGPVPPPPAPTMTLDKVERPWFKMKRWWVAGFVLVLFVVGAVGGGGSTDDDAPVASDSSTSVDEVPAEEEVVAEEAEVEPEPTEEPEPELTGGQENAVAAAANYLDLTSFSRSGLIEQLEFEEYSTDDATFAVDYLEPDWNEQAAKKAEEYLDLTPFSRGGLIDQLEFDGFSAEQAAYGVDQTDL